MPSKIGIVQINSVVRSAGWLDSAIERPFVTSDIGRWSLDVVQVRDRFHRRCAMIRLGSVGGFFFLLVRGFALWILVPFAVIALIFVHWWAQRASIGQAICWYDQNFLAILILGPFRYLMHRNPEMRAAKFFPLSGMPTTKTYKMFPTDFV